ncbi:MAG: PD-(D/E)XK nuclease family protein [Candidatus Kerfeldbacteria bacterium]|nr:PD-(D/E)XK nuclease family protein [Candidatus Kerfeldbacteria bacterium]
MLPTLKLSRSKIELFLDCPRCYWLDAHKINSRPAPMPYTINSAIDFLLKREFDECRHNDLEHYLIKKYKIDAKPYNGEKMDEWRHNFTGVQHQHASSGFLVFGAVDDVWVNSLGELMVVDYKATGAREHRIYDSYKRQMEVYQWLLRQNGYKVSSTGYFLFAKVNKEKKFDNGQLNFDLYLEPCLGDSSWVEEAIVAARQCYNAKSKPAVSQECTYCNYVAAAK